ncbi:hypothetical protein FSP39_001873 [Pinctada imbricata]|uniref:Major facilitator superfamily (MFS) profile domain-containing protein n=1 Tax=Pinctada imbricata TaxID=66713 RepID=A0AA88XYF5_PINIB|nr:hypothetical protein FSP39_001873 [Pinctada imbricata]
MSNPRDWKGYGTYTTELHEVNVTGSSSDEENKDMAKETGLISEPTSKSGNKLTDEGGLVNKAYVNDEESYEQDTSARTIYSDENRTNKSSNTNSYTPPFRCKDLQGNLSDYNTGLQGNVSDFWIGYDKCELTIHSSNHTPPPYTGMKPKTYDCLNGYHYDYDDGETVTMEWNLVCDKSGLGEFSTTMVIIGICIGGVIFTGLADRFGRKTVAVYTHILLLVCNVALTFMPIFAAFAGLRLFIGAFQQGLGLSTAITLIEMFPVEWRGFLGLPGALNWTFCVCTLALFAYIMKSLSWRYLQIVLSLVSIHALFGNWILDESLRWLVANKRYKEAANNIRKAAKWNKKDAEKILPLLYTKNQESDPLNEADKEDNAYTKVKTKPNFSEVHSKEGMKQDSSNRYTMMDILRNKILLRNSIILWYTWLVNSGVYYGLFLISGDLSVGNRYLNFFINGLVEIPAAFMYYALINRIGRKYTSVVFHGIAGVSLILSVVFLMVSTKSGDTASIVSLIFSYAGKLGISASFNTVFIYTPELYPTNLRNLGIGLASAAGRVGGVLSPYSTILMRNIAWGPGALFGSACLLAMALMFLLPETGSYVLPQTIEEMEAWVKEQSYFRPLNKMKTSTTLKASREEKTNEG